MINLVRSVQVVSERTLIRRINRLLAHDGYQLLKTRRSRATGKRKLTDREREFGTYFVVGDHVNHIVEKHVDLEKFARKHGALSAYEKLAR